MIEICGHRGLLPQSLIIPFRYDPKGDPLCQGVFGDVWKSRYNGRDVAVKVSRVYQKNFDLERARRVSCCLCFRLVM